MSQAPSEVRTRARIIRNSQLMIGVQRARQYIGMIAADGAKMICIHSGITADGAEIVQHASSLALDCRDYNQ